MYISVGADRAGAHSAERGQRRCKQRTASRTNLLFWGERVYLHEHIARLDALSLGGGGDGLQSGRLGPRIGATSRQFSNGGPVPSLP